MRFEEHLKGEGIDLVRANVGDRYVLEQMIETGSAAGGGSAAGVGLPSSTGVGMAIQWEQMEAQKELAKAEAAKTNAEAAKLMTTDTEKVNPSCF